jgi:hypothetical protein
VASIARLNRSISNCWLIDKAMAVPAGWEAEGWESKGDADMG